MSDDPVVVALDARQHREMQALLPWFAAGTLDALDRARVEAHLADCAHCQAELAFERRLQALHGLAQDRSGGDDRAIERGLARLRDRLEERSRLSRAWRSLRGRLGAFLRPAPRFAALGASALLGAALAALLPPLAGSYRALGTPGTEPPGGLIVMFRAGTSEAELRQALRAAGARIVDGPTASDAYVLAVPAGAEGAALAALRAQGVVALAEPLTAPPERP